MLSTQCISITDLRTKTKQCLDDLSKDPKYVFVNNKPVAVILDIKSYEKHFLDSDLRELSFDELSVEILKEAKISKKIPKSELINI